MTNETFLTDVTDDGAQVQLRTSELDKVIETTENNVTHFTRISDDLVKAYTEDLDNLMQKINEDTVLKEPTDRELEQYVLELSNMLYFVGSRLESMGIRDDLSKLAAKQVYNNTYLETGNTVSGKKPTVAELSAIAEDSSRYETIMNNIYSRAYRQIKYKSDAAYEMLSSLRKIISKRMQELQLSMQRYGEPLILKEAPDGEEAF